MKYLIATAVLCFIGLHLMVAQNTDVFGNKIPTKKKVVTPLPENYNKLDAQGRKQGPWEKRYTDGTPLYTATFKDNKPVGEYQRFYPNGKVSSRVVYDEKGEKGLGELFDEKGELTAKGVFMGQQKEGEWTFYSGGIVASTELYANNMRNGQATVFYPDGKVSETIYWKDDVKHGAWLKYFPNGSVMLKSQYVSGKLEGPYLYYFPNGKLEIEANYKNDLEDGDWTFYKDDGSVNYTLKYSNGTLLNPEVMEAIRAKEESEFEKNRENLKDPEKMQNNPDAFMRNR